MGERIRLQYSRSIIDAIHSGELLKAEYENHGVFNLAVPVRCTGVPAEILHPERCWKDVSVYEKSVRQLAGLFRENFRQYEDEACSVTKSGGPSEA